jgi:hypothetical protein
VRRRTLSGSLRNIHLRQWFKGAITRSSLAVCRAKNGSLELT